jgi:hypothetical protein
MDTSNDQLKALFARQPTGLDFPGPFQWHEVVLHGRQVPFLRAAPIDGGVHLVLDSRLGLDLTIEEAHRIIPFLADSIAVALGYTCHPQPECPEPVKRPPFPRMQPIGWTETDSSA